MAYNFDGCGINRDGRRVLTGSRADWDEPEFKAFCTMAAEAPALVVALQGACAAMDAALNADEYDDLDQALLDARAVLARIGGV